MENFWPRIGGERQEKERLTLQNAIDRSYHNMCLLVKNKNSSVLVADEFKYFCQEELMRHFLYDIVLYTHALVKLLDTQENTNIFKDLIPGKMKHELEKQQRIADDLSKNPTARMTELATTYSQLLLSCSNFENDTEDLNFFECFYLFTVEVIKMHVRRREWWKAIRQQIAWLLCGPTRSLVEFAKDDFDTNEIENKETSNVLQFRTLDDFMEDNTLLYAGVGNPTQNIAREPNKTVDKHAVIKMQRGTARKLRATGGGNQTNCFGATTNQSIHELPIVAGRGGGGYFFRHQDQIERMREAMTKKKLWNQSQGEMMHNTLARKAAGRRAEKGEGPKALAQKMIRAVRSIENSQKICEQVLANRERIRIEKKRLSPRPRVELTLDKLQNFGTPLISKISPRVQVAAVPPVQPQQLVPSIPSTTKPKSSRLTNRQQRVIESFKNSRTGRGTVLSEDQELADL